MKTNSHIMRRTFTILALSCLPLLAAEPPLPLVPQPRAVEQAQGTYKLPATVRVSAAADLKNESAYLNERLAKGLGLKMKNMEGKADITLALSNKLGAEAYALKVTATGVTIEGGDPAGVFYGVQTFLQLLPPEVYGNAAKASAALEIPCVAINDAPALPWRGLHLDCARHFMPKEFVIKYLDLMAMQKMNRFHWHLVDSEGWRIEIKKYPKLTQIGQDAPASYPGEDPTDHKVRAGFKYGDFHGGGFYSQQDIKDIVAHAAKRHITIMPEIEFPAHAMLMFTAYPEFSTTGKVPTVKSNHSPDLLNVDEKSLNFLKDILDETMALFPGKWIHFGGDEAPKGQWKESAFVQQRIKELGLKDENALQSWLFTQMAEHVAKKGRVAVGWEEITHGGTPANAVVMPWLSMATAAKVANEGHPIILCPVDPLYLDSKQTSDPDDNQALYQGPTTLQKVYNFSTDLPAVAPDKKANIWGAQAQLWTELMPKPEHVEYQAYPRATALAENLWSTKENRNFRDFHTRVAAHLKRLDALKVNYRKLEPLAPIVWSPQTLAPARKDAIHSAALSGPIAAGKYIAHPQYMSGSHGLNFERIELVVDGQVVASDTHRGFTGNSPKDADYHLEVNEAIPAGRSIELRAVADSSGGTNSHGEISFRPAK